MTMLSMRTFVSDSLCINVCISITATIFLNQTFLKLNLESGEYFSIQS